MLYLDELLEKKENPTPGALEAFEKVGLPNKKTEAFRTFPLNSYYKNPISFAPDGGHTFKQIPDGIEVLSLDKAGQKYRPILSKLERKHLDQEGNPFLLAHNLLKAQGHFIYVPPHTVIEEPLVIDVDAIGFVKLQIFLGEGASLNCRLHTQKISGHHLIDMHLESRAALNLVSTYSAASAPLFESHRAHLKEKAQLKTFSFADQQALLRQDVAITLDGREAHAAIKGLALLDGSNEHHQSVLMRHRAEETTSHQHFKAILSDRSKGVFEGKIDVAAKAQKTDAYQLCNHLLNSPDARSHARPGLEILADDVKASHGATVAACDEMQKFYLCSRGLTSDESDLLLKKAFVYDVIDPLFDKELKGAILRKHFGAK